jgi:hypothetical protein
MQDPPLTWRQIAGLVVYCMAVVVVLVLLGLWAG